MEKEENIKAKTDMAASVFGTICREFGGMMLDDIVTRTVRVTNAIWEGIKE